MDYGQYVAEIALFRGVARGGAGGSKPPRLHLQGWTTSSPTMHSETSTGSISAQAKFESLAEPNTD